jgi:hypothetical protein
VQQQQQKHSSLASIIFDLQRRGTLFLQVSGEFGKRMKGMQAAVNAKVQSQHEMEREGMNMTALCHHQYIFCVFLVRKIR